MTKNLIVYTVIGAVIVIGGGYFLLMSKSASAPVSESEVQGTKTSVQSEDSVDDSLVSMRDLVAKGESVECAYDMDVQYSKSNGTVYIADGKVRGNFNITVSMSQAGTQEFKAYMIAEGDTSYVWSSAMNQGFKIPIPENQPENAPQSGVDYNQKLNYTCKPWNKDSSFFVPPADITFSDAPIVPQQ